MINHLFLLAKHTPTLIYMPTFGKICIAADNPCKISVICITLTMHPLMTWDVEPIHTYNSPLALLRFVGYRTQCIWFRLMAHRYGELFASVIWKLQPILNLLQIYWKSRQETCRSMKLRELSACGRFVSHTKATERKCRMTAHGPSSTSQLRRPLMLRCHCLPPGSLDVLGAFGSLS